MGKDRRDASQKTFRFLLLAVMMILAAGCAGGSEQAQTTADPLMRTLTVAAIIPTDLPDAPTVLIPETAQTGLPAPTVGPEDGTPLPLGTVPAVTPQGESADMIAPAQTPQCSPPAPPTPPMTEGPYYKPGAPERTSLLEEGIPGQRLLLTGYVLDTSCQPVAGARLDFWQADGSGAYDNAGYALRGQQVTGADGSYRLETVLPGEYPGRTPHIHVKVVTPALDGGGGTTLTTQLFFPGMRGNQTDRIFDPALIVREAEPASDADTIQAAFDFIVTR